VLCEDLPEEHNRIVLDPDRADADGVPGVRVEYRLSENSRRMLAFMVDRATESLEAAGAWKVEATWPLGNAHLMGTARMGDDPATSVVDRWCVSHDVPNLLVVDGSVFVTAGSANPTSTIVAIAQRAAERLLERRADLPTPSLPRPVAVPAPLTRTQTPVEPPPPRLTSEEVARFASLADELVPAADGMPTWSAADPDGALLHRVLSIRPDLADPIRAALAADGPPAAVLAGLGRSELRAVRYAAAGAYYLAPEVRRLLDYTPEPATPVAPFAYPAYLEEGLLDHLVG
jgi:hypothetical protein